MGQNVLEVTRKCIHIEGVTLPASSMADLENVLFCGLW